MEGVKRKLGGDPTSYTSAHASEVTVAPFQAWRSSRPSIAREPIGSP